MADVARLAGVSLVTVSRAINEPARVAPQTLARITDAIRQIGYVPNLLAGSLASSRTRIVAALVPTLSSSIFSETVQGMSDVLAAADYQLLIGHTRYDRELEHALVATFLGRRVDGLILTGIGHAQTTRQQLLRLEVPVVETWDLTPSPIDCVVGFSNRQAGQAMTEYLLSRGYGRIGFAGGGDERSTSRREGWQAALAAAGLDEGPWMELPPPATVADGRRALTALLARDPALRAVFFSNDALALGALFECQRLGLDVPGRIAIAGFTDTEFAAEVSPTLTTVHVRGREIGEQAARTVLARIERREDVQSVVDVGYAIVARESA